MQSQNISFATQKMAQKKFIEAILQMHLIRSFAKIIDRKVIKLNVFIES